MTLLYIGIFWANFGAKSCVGVTGWHRRKEVGKGGKGGKGGKNVGKGEKGGKGGSPRPKSLKICKNVKEYSLHLLSLIPASWQQALVSGFSGGLEMVVGFRFWPSLATHLGFHQQRPC